MKRSPVVRPMFLLAAAAGLALAVSAALQYTPQEQLRIVPAKHLPGKVHLLPATLETTQWGWFDNAQPPVLRISPGDCRISRGGERCEILCTFSPDGGRPSAAGR